MSASRPDYGPRGYLPQRAAKRARKIVLREQMGLGWVVAALVAAAVVVVAGGWYTLTALRPPGPPFEPAGELRRLEPGTVEVVTLTAGDADVLTVRAAGAVRAFLPADVAIMWCPRTRRLESPGGQVWDLDGRLVGGDGASLARLPLAVHGGRLYADPTAPVRPEPAPSGATPRCATG